MTVNDWFQCEIASRDLTDISRATLLRILNLLACKDKLPDTAFLNQSDLESSIDLEIQSANKDLYNKYKMLNIHGDAYKYYILDMITNGCYIKSLIGHINYCYTHGVKFAFNLDPLAFKQRVSDSCITILFRYTKDSVRSDINLYGILYNNPIQGDLQLEEGLCILTDTLFLLTPDFMTFLINKLLSGKSSIVYSQHHKVLLKPILYEQKEAVNPDIIDTTVDCNFYNEGMTAFKYLQNNLFSYGSLNLDGDTVRQYLGR